MFAFQIRQAAEAAPRDKLSDVSKVLWAALGAGSVTEDEAETLSAFIEARRAPAATPTLRKPVGSRPRTDASMARRRTWAASGRLPPQLAAQFTQAEVAVLAVVAMEVSKRGDCRLANGHIAAIAGVSKSTVRATLRRARALGAITSTERRVSRFRSDTNIVKIVARSWVSWMKLARRDTRPVGGDISVARRNTRSSREGHEQAPGRSQRASEYEKLERSGNTRAARP